MPIGFATFARDLRYEDLPDKVVRLLRRSLLDTMGSRRSEARPPSPPRPAASRAVGGARRRTRRRAGCCSMEAAPALPAPPWRARLP